MKKILITALYLLLLTGPLFGMFGSGPGSTGYDYLNLPLGARRSAMAAGSAVTGDCDVYWWNPASLVYVERPVAGLMYNSYIEGISQQRAGFTFPMENMSVGALNINMIQYGEIEGYDWEGISRGNVEAGSYSLSYSQARRFSPALSGGLSLKLIYEQLEDESAFAAAFDGGTIIEVYPGVKLGGGWKNLGMSGNFIDEAPSLPLSFFAGMGLRLNHFILLAGDLNFIDGEFKIASGVELDLWNTFFFRGGWDSFTGLDEAFRAGAGWKFSGTSINYAYAPYDRLGNTHRMDVSFKFGRPPMIERIYRRGRSLYRDEDYREAWVEFNKVKTLNPRYKRAAYWLERTEEIIREKGR